LIQSIYIDSDKLVIYTKNNIYEFEIIGNNLLSYRGLKIRSCYLHKLLHLLEYNIPICKIDSSQQCVSINRSKITIGAAKFYLNSISSPVIREVFIEGLKNFSKIDNKTIILDIGAYVGDTAIYYASQGAEVISLEPSPINYRYLVKNIKLNKLNNKIVPILGAYCYGSITKKFLVEPIPDASLSVISKPSIFKLKRIRVRCYTLRDLLKMVKNNFEFTNLYLKVDCKGCEKEIITKELDILKNFDEINIEYDPRFSELKIDKLLHILSNLSKDITIKKSASEAVIIHIKI